MQAMNEDIFHCDLIDASLALEIATNFLLKFADVHALLLLGERKANFVGDQMPRGALPIQLHGLGIELVAIPSEGLDVHVGAADRPVPAIASAVAQIFGLV